MTPAQRKRLYFPAWHAAKGACWVWAGGRLGRVSEPASVWVALVEGVARQIAGPEYRGITAEDLRHGCNALALRRAKAHRARLPEESVPVDLRPRGYSVEAFTDRHDLSLGLFLALCELLRDDASLGAALNWTHPENIEREYMLRVMERRMDAGYVAAVCRSMYHTEDAAALEPEALAELYRTLGQRPKAWVGANAERGARNAECGTRSAEYAGADCPF